MSWKCQDYAIVRCSEALQKKEDCANYSWAQMKEDENWSLNIRLSTTLPLGTLLSVFSSIGILKA